MSISSASANCSGVSSLRRAVFGVGRATSGGSGGKFSLLLSGSLASFSGPKAIPLSGMSMTRAGARAIRPPVISPVTGEVMSGG